MWHGFGSESCCVGEMVDFQRRTNIRLDVLRVREEEEVDQRLGLLVIDQSMPVIAN